MLRGIPPRTMADVSRGWGRAAGPAAEGAGRGPAPRVERAPQEAPVAPLAKPRQWLYQTRPSFKRVRGPLVDVFSEAEEVLVVVDLGGFTRGEISLRMTPRAYVICAVRGEQRFEETIGLPANIDLERARERLANGVLEIVLPRKKTALAPARKAEEESRE